MGNIPPFPQLNPTLFSTKTVPFSQLAFLSSSPVVTTRSPTILMMAHSVQARLARSHTTLIYRHTPEQNAFPKFTKTTIFSINLFEFCKIQKAHLFSETYLLDVEHNTRSGRCKFFAHLEEVEFQLELHLQMEAALVADRVYIRPSIGQRFAPPYKEFIRPLMIYSELIFSNLQIFATRNTKLPIIGCEEVLRWRHD